MSVQTVYASAARTATPTAVTISTRRAKALFVVINVTAATATPSVVPTIDGYDSTSDTWFNLLTGAAITDANGDVRLRVGNGLPVTANVSANDYLPDRVRVVMTHGDADSITYSVSAHLVD